MLPLVSDRGAYEFTVRVARLPTFTIEAWIDRLTMASRPAETLTATPEDLDDAAADPDCR